jgi:hypothetical protein
MRRDRPVAAVLFSVVLGFAARGKVPYTDNRRRLKDFLMAQDLSPGMLVHHPNEPDWGIGQVQSVIGERITVNFQHRGKVLINAARIALVVVEDEGGLTGATS